MRSTAIVKAFCLCAMTVVSLGVSAGVPQIINYQGKLTDEIGDPVEDNVYSMKYTIYDAPTAGNALWSTYSGGFTPIQTEKGLFSHLLGSTNPLPDSLVNYDSLWLGITVAPDAELTPRTPIVSVNFAFKALVSENAFKADSAAYAEETGHSKWADTSNFSIASGHANSSDSATNAIYADTASYTVYADTAVYVAGTYRRLGADLVGGGVSSTDWEQAGSTISIPAGEVSSYVIVSFVVQGFCHACSNITNSASYDLRIGLDGAEDSKETQVFFSGWSNTDNHATTRRGYFTYQYYYEPTAAEKSSGFNVMVFLRVSSTSGASASLFKCEVFGM